MAARSRPRSVTLVSILVLITAGIYLIRLIQALLNWSMLAALPGVSPLYLALTGLFWATLGGFVSLSLWTGKPYAGRAARIFILGYSFYFWLDRILMAKSPGRLDKAYDLPFLIGINVLLLALFFGVLSRRKVRLFLGETYGNRSENPET